MPDLKAFLALDEFTKGYVEAMLWAETDDAGSPLDARYGPDHLSQRLWDQAVEDCRTFQAEQAALLVPGNLTTAVDCGLAAYAGHDFWLTRRGHGCGFWDGDWAEPAASVLTAAAKTYRNVDLCVGDDGLIYSE